MEGGGGVEQTFVVVMKHLIISKGYVFLYIKMNKDRTTVYVRITSVYDFGKNI